MQTEYQSITLTDMIKDFQFYAPTRVVFGRESEEELPSLIQACGATKVLIHYGGGSVIRSGLLSKIKNLLDEAKIEYTELGGVVPNPLLSKVKEGIELCRTQHVDFILAVGGGSVIDSAKAIGYGVPYQGDAWDFWSGKATPVACLPIGVVLTIPAAGSEMSSSCVITKDEGLLKRGVNSDICRCRFAIMNPERTYTLPAYQTAAGATDILMHTLERYFSKYTDMTLTDALAEALMRTVIESTRIVMSEPKNYIHRAQIMWAGSLSHNDLMQCGTEKDFATHKLEHELSALFGVTHGAGLAAIWGSWARFVMHGNEHRFAQFAIQVMNVPSEFGTIKEIAEEGICRLESFFTEIGMPINLCQLLGRQITEAEIEELVKKCSNGGTTTIGALKTICADDMRVIYNMAQ